LKFFSRNKELSDPTIVVNSCLQLLLDRITDDLDKEGYAWDKPWGVKRFESMVLAKFIMDYSFERTVEGKLSDEEKNGYYNLSNTSFSSTFNAEFSKIGINIENMQADIDKKVEAYFTTIRGDHKPPECYYQIYMLITGSQSREELEEEIKMKTTGLEFMRINENFAHMVTEYELQLNHLKQKVSAFDVAQIMLPHMLRTAMQKVKNINLKKIKNLSKKLAKKDKKK
jgi:hypothetical protein